MPNKKLDSHNQEGLCPKCDNKMEVVSPEHYYCQQCKQHYLEQFICPICQQQAQIIKGCGAINYICPNDGLISSSKVIFHYLPE